MEIWKDYEIDTIAKTAEEIAEMLIKLDHYQKDRLSDTLRVDTLDIHRATYDMISIRNLLIDLSAHNHPVQKLKTRPEPRVELGLSPDARA